MVCVVSSDRAVLTLQQSYLNYPKIESSWQASSKSEAVEVEVKPKVPLMLDMQNLYDRKTVANEQRRSLCSLQLTCETDALFPCYDDSISSIPCSFQRSIQSSNCSCCCVCPLEPKSRLACPMHRSVLWMLSASLSRSHSMPNNVDSGHDCKVFIV